MDSLATSALVWALALSMLLGWVLYFRENKYRRDVLTDLLGVLYRNDLGRDELRRSLGYDAVEKRLDVWAHTDADSVTGEDLSEDLVTDAGKVETFDASRTVEITTPSRTWSGTPEEFYELSSAFEGIEFEAADEQESGGARSDGE